MAVETISNMSSAVDAKNDQKNKKSDGDDKSKVTNKPVPTLASASPNSDITNGLKRPLPDESVNLGEIKKIRLDEKSNDKPEDINFKSLNGINHDQKDHLDSLDKKLDKLTELAENNEDEHSNTSSNSIKSNNEITVNETDSNKSIKDEELNSASKENINKKVIENESININNVNDESVNNSQIIVNDTVSIINSEKKLIPNDATISEDSSELNRLSLENCANEESVEEVEEVSQSTMTKQENNQSSVTTNSEKEISKKCENDTKTLSELNDHKKKNSISVTDDNAKIQIDDNGLVGNNDRVEEEMVVSDNDDDCKIVESDRNSKKSSKKNNLIDDEQISAILKGTNKLNRQTFPYLLKLFEKKDVTFDQFESLINQKVVEYLTEKTVLGKERSEIKMLQEKEKFWRIKYASVTKQLKELKTILRIHRLDLKDDKNAKPHIVTRTVGLQAVLCTKREMSRLPVLKPPNQVNEPVVINSDEDDDIFAVDVEGETTQTENTTSRIVLEAAKSTKTVENTIPKKQSFIPNVPKITQVVLAKPVPPSTPISSVNDDPIDLTDDLNDDVNDVSKGLNLSPVKIVHPTLNKGVLAGISPTQLSNNMSAQVVPKNVAYIELQNMPTSTSGYIVRTSTSPTGSTQLTSVSNLNAINNSKSVRPYLLKQGRLLPLQISAVGPRQLQSGAIYTAHQVPTSRLTGPLPRAPPPAIPLNAVPQLKPLLKHPAPLPDVPNQRSLTTWKKLPSAPLVNLAKSTDVNNPKALVLSWNMNMNSSVAEITSYQIFAYHEMANEPPRKELWKKIGDVNALPLPMACSLTQFSNGQKYHFTVRAVDKYNRVGPFSPPQSVHLISK